MHDLRFSFANTALLYQTESDFYAANLCPGDDVTFTCSTSSTLTFTWLVTDGDGARTTCTASTDGQLTVPTCGPMDIFSVNVSGDGSTSTLSAQSVDDTVNGTRVLCGDEDANETVCIACEKRLRSLIHGYSYMHFAH